MADACVQSASLLVPPPVAQVSEHARKRDRENSRYISILNVIQGDVDPTQVGLCKSRGGSVKKKHLCVCVSVCAFASELMSVRAKMHANVCMCL